jgi:hypothetical protein
MRIWIKAAVDIASKWNVETDPNGVHVFAQKNQLNWVKQRILKITQRQATCRRFQKARKYVEYSRIPACVGVL